MSKVSGHPYLLIIFGCHILQLSYFGNLSIEVHNEKISIILEVEDITYEFYPRQRGVSWPKLGVGFGLCGLCIDWLCFRHN